MVSLIVAVSENGVIGNGDKIPWRLSGDMRWFKEKTTGNIVVMGRKTAETLPKGLPNRFNLIVSSNPRVMDVSANPPIVWTYSIDMAIEIGRSALPAYYGKEVFICGGASLYKEALERGLVDTVYLTKVHCDSVEGDVLFDDRWLTSGGVLWEVSYAERFPADEKNQYDYTLSILKRV